MLSTLELPETFDQKTVRITERYDPTIHFVYHNGGRRGVTYVEIVREGLREAGYGRAFALPCDLVVERTYCVRDQKFVPDTDRLSTMDRICVPAYLPHSLLSAFMPRLYDIRVDRTKIENSLLRSVGLGENRPVGERASHVLHYLKNENKEMFEAFMAVGRNKASTASPDGPAFSAIVNQLVAKKQIEVIEHLDRHGLRAQCIRGDSVFVSIGAYIRDGPAMTEALLSHCSRIQVFCTRPTGMGLPGPHMLEDRCIGDEDDEFLPDEVAEWANPLRVEPKAMFAKKVGGMTEGEVNFQSEMDTTKDKEEMDRTMATVRGEFEVEYVTIKSFPSRHIFGATLKSAYKITVNVPNSKAYATVAEICNIVKHTMGEDLIKVEGDGGGDNSAVLYCFDPSRGIYLSHESVLQYIFAAFQYRLGAHCDSNQNVSSIAKRLMVTLSIVPRHVFDKMINKIGRGEIPVKNGIMHISTGQVRPYRKADFVLQEIIHDWEPPSSELLGRASLMYKSYLTSRDNVHGGDAYLDSALVKVWDLFHKPLVESILADAVLMRMVMLLMTPTLERKKILELVGETNSGKTSVQGLFGHCFKPWVGIAVPALLTAQAFADEKKLWLFEKRDARLIQVSEPGVLSRDFMCSLSGNDPQNVRGHYKGYNTFTLNAGFVIAENFPFEVDKPPDEAMQSRREIFRLTSKFDPDATADNWESRTFMAKSKDEIRDLLDSPTGILAVLALSNYYYVKHEETRKERGGKSHGFSTEVSEFDVSRERSSKKVMTASSVIKDAIRYDPDSGEVAPLRQFAQELIASYKVACPELFAGGVKAVERNIRAIVEAQPGDDKYRGPKVGYKKKENPCKIQGLYFVPPAEFNSQCAHDDEDELSRSEQEREARRWPAVEYDAFFGAPKRQRDEESPPTPKPIKNAKNLMAKAPKAPESPPRSPMRVRNLVAKKQPGGAANWNSRAVDWRGDTV